MKHILLAIITRIFLTVFFFLFNLVIIAESLTVNLVLVLGFLITGKEIEALPLSISLWAKFESYRSKLIYDK